MLDVNTQGEVRHINVRAEIHGDEIEPAFDVKLMLIDVPVSKITTLCAKLDRLYENDVVALGEVNPLTVQHKVENVQATIGDYSSTGCDIKKGAKIQLLPGQIANVEVTLQFHSGNVEAVVPNLRETVKVTISERQLSMVDSG